MSAMTSEQVAAFADVAKRGMHILWHAGMWCVMCDGFRGFGSSPEAAALACKSAKRWAELGGSDAEAAAKVYAESGTAPDQHWEDPLPRALR